MVPSEWNAVSDWQFAKSWMQNPRIQRGNCTVIEKDSSIVIENIYPCNSNSCCSSVNCNMDGFKKVNLENAGGRYEKQIGHM